MKLETTKHTLRLSHLSVMQQQRTLNRLAKDARNHSKVMNSNAESEEANTYDWHRNVRLKREARAYNLIRAYLKGLPYKQVEQNLKPTTIAPYVAIMSSSAYPYFKWDNHVAIHQWIAPEMHNRI